MFVAGAKNSSVTSTMVEPRAEEARSRHVCVSVEHGLRMEYYQCSRPKQIVLILQKRCGCKSLWSREERESIGKKKVIFINAF